MLPAGISAKLASRPAELFSSRDDVEAPEEVVDDSSSTSVVSTKRLGALMDERRVGGLFISPSAETRAVRGADEER
jgi:hypothetical protein